MNPVNEDVLQGLLVEIGKLKARITVLEVEAGRNWESLCPTQNGGFDVPSDQTVRTLASELKMRKLDVTDVKLLHIFDMLLHLFSVWPVLPQTTRHYAYNMARLVNIASTDSWSAGVQQSNGFSPQLVPPPINGHQIPEANRNNSPSLNTISRAANDFPTAPETPTQLVYKPTQHQEPTAEEPVPTNDNVAAVASTSASISVDNQTENPTQSTPGVENTSPTRISLKRESDDQHLSFSPLKVANMSRSTFNPSMAMFSPNVLGHTQSPLTYEPKCLCRKSAHRFLVRKESVNKGRYFYKCFNYSLVVNPEQECGFFVWEDELPEKQPKACSNCNRAGHNKTNCPSLPRK